METIWKPVEIVTTPNEQMVFDDTDYILMLNPDHTINLRLEAKTV